MPKITITQNGEIIAHHTTGTPLSHYGQPVWIIEDDSPEPGHAVFEEAESGTKFEIEILGIVGGWLIIRQPATDQAPALLAGIIWSDGNYYGDLVQTRDGANFIENATLDDLAGGDYMIKNTIVGVFNEAAPLGSILI
jgi:hypothetical protein